MPIYSVVYYITVGESASTNSLKYLILRLKSVIAVGKTEVSNLYKTFLDFFFKYNKGTPLLLGRGRKI